MLFCCLWRNVETFCHKHFVVVSRYQQTPPLTTSDKCHNLPRSGGAVLITPSRSQHWKHAMKPDIGSESRFLPTHLHSTLPLWGFSSEYYHDFWYGKSRIVWLPDVEKSLKIYLFVSAESTNVTDTQTDTHTPHDGQGRACITSRGKKCGQSLLSSDF